VIKLSGLLIASTIALGTLAAPTAAGAQTLASLSITKIAAPDPVLAGTNLAYTITASNEGPDAAASATLDDMLPAGTTFVSLGAPAGWGCSTPAVGAAGTVSCTNPSFAVGSDIFTLTVQVGAGVVAGTILANTATVGSATADPHPDDNSATAFTTVGAVSPDLSLSVVGVPDPVTVGNDATFTITLDSVLPDAIDATLTVPLPAGATFQSFAAPSGWACALPAVGGTGTVVCTNPSPPAPGSAAFTLVLRAGSSFAGGDTFDTTASLLLSSGGREVVATDTETTTVVAPASLSANKTVAGSFLPGSGVTYTLVLTNGGPGTQADGPTDELSDVLPASLTLVSAAATSGSAVANLGTNTVIWNGAVPASGAVTITVVATLGLVLPGTIVQNQAALSWDGDGDGVSEATGVSDDPGVGGAADPTELVVGQPPPIVTVPTLNELGLVLLAGVLGLLAVGRLTRRAAS
jgi:uncharacterized repeat protein (TIGR01451 family)